MTAMPEPPPGRIHPVPAGALPATVYSVDRTIRFGHCDPAGQVFFPRWLELLAEVVEQWFVEALAIDYYGVIRGGTGLGSVRIETDFFRPAVMGDVVRFRILIERIGTASFTIVSHCHRDAEELWRARQVIATSDISQFRAKPLPPDLRQALEAYCGRTQQ